MGTKDKDKSLLEIAVELLGTKHKPQPLKQLAKEAMEIKGLKTAQAKEILPQFLLDFQSSGYFVYCGEGLWDLKDRQPTSVLDKDGTDYEIYAEEDEDVKKNELKDDSYDLDSHVDRNRDEDDEEEDDDIESALKESSDNDGELDVEEGVITGYEEEDEEDE